MQCLVIYDIPNDRARTKIADVCLDYGLDRIQFSAFLGQLARTHQEELLIQIKKVLGKKAGDVQIFPFCEKDERLRLSIHQGSEVGPSAQAATEAIPYPAASDLVPIPPPEEPSEEELPPL